ncbi:hypothetical protein KEM55_006612 [Ascosphaera atra]|nr:hypothetical protein KEM55_006612 [Ascosphaera atra]
MATPASGADELLHGPSEQRRLAINALTRALRFDTIHVTVWSLFQVCDIQKLEDYVRKVTRRPHDPFLLLPFDNARFLPKAWAQKSHFQTTAAAAIPRLPRSTSSRNDAAMRDGHRCVITKQDVYKVAHIFPHCLIGAAEDNTTALEAHSPSAWRLLMAFWPENKVRRWKDCIFPRGPGPNGRLQPRDGIFNQLCLRDDLHTAWAQGRFALRPLSVSEDKTALTVELHWLLPPNHDGPNSYVDPLLSPPTSAGVKGAGDYELIVRDVRPGEHFRAVASLDQFTIRTSDPVNLPLPSFDLLEMAWFLSRMVSLSAAAEDDRPFNFFDNDDGSAGALSAAMMESDSEHERVCFRQAAPVVVQQSAQPPLPPPSLASSRENAPSDYDDDDDDDSSIDSRQGSNNKRRRFE